MSMNTKKRPLTKDQTKTPSSETSQSQRERFIETARKLEADESGETFELAFSKIVPPSKANTPRKID